MVLRKTFGSRWRSGPERVGKGRLGAGRGPGWSGTGGGGPGGDAPGGGRACGQDGGSPGKGDVRVDT